MKVIHVFTTLPFLTPSHPITTPNPFTIMLPYTFDPHRRPLPPNPLFRTPAQLSSTVYDPHRRPPPPIPLFRPHDQLSSTVYGPHRRPPPPVPLFVPPAQLSSTAPDPRHRPQPPIPLFVPPPSSFPSSTLFPPPILPLPSSLYTEKAKKIKAKKKARNARKAERLPYKTRQDKRQRLKTGLARWEPPTFDFAPTHDKAVMFSSLIFSPSNPFNANPILLFLR